MAEHPTTAAAVTETTCGICLEEPKDPMNLPCGHSFCEGCLGEWRSRYGVKEEMRRKCPICRARIPPSKEMVATLLVCRARKKNLEHRNETSSEQYYRSCLALEQAEEDVGADWDGVTVLEDNHGTPAVLIPVYIGRAIMMGDITKVLKWINANRTEDRANSKVRISSLPALTLACMNGHLSLMTQLLQAGANIDLMACNGSTAIGYMFTSDTEENLNDRIRLSLSWGASFFPDGGLCGTSREYCIRQATTDGEHELANLLKSELGGRRCEIINLSSSPELNGKTCVADEYLQGSDLYKVTLETKSKEVLLLDSGNLKRRDRTPQDCGYYVEFKNGRTIRHDFDSNEDCQAFVAALNNNGETQPAVTVEEEAAAEQAAAELLAELGLDDSPGEASRGCKAKKSKKKKGGKKKRK
ncbi:hypothetical protein THAOC_11954 [Thalassiosira oceanica]|uniref:RING-type domain-containing protein n=1 Tax=Thalassiosira oceanica TaxID=159749 RepID=K0T1A8_THAOC|nr:hypothetical protein THAOC_11954 [Thalassiosira oceanica]|eukprot:EJK67061.1 hypothetical protein THAOC_11954 [Thalassiosira oceanica]